MLASLRHLLLIVCLIGAAEPLLAAATAPTYVTSARCAECHRAAYDAWTDSHHGWAWRPAEPANVLGDFNDATFEHRGVESRFTTRDGRYFVETDGPDGRRSTYEIAGTVGVTPLQQYLVDTGDGHLQALDVVWDTQRHRWYALYPELETESDPGLHWTGPYRSWNARCVSCHVTGFIKGYEPAGDRYRSSWSEMGVGCEACHGPGEAHLAWAKQPGSASLARFAGVDEKGLTVSASGDPKAAAERCAGCHSRRETLDADSPPPGEPYADHYRLTLLREGLYHADGQIDDEVYVYGSFLQSKMNARGVACGNCHEPHSGKLVAEGDAVCTQCHNPQGRKEFPTLRAASYVSPVHHRHPAGSEAARCVSCHMPTKTYMGVDPRRDHSFRVPRPDLTVKLGVPNACTGCHADRPAAWAQEQVAAWFPQGHHLRPHYGEVLQAGRKELDTTSVTRLLDLASDAAQPAIVRASALELAAPATTPQIAGAALPLLTDPSPLVRSAALALFDPAPQAARAKYAGPLLDDPVRTVRIAAAQRILDLSTEHLSEAERAIVDKAVGEYQGSLAAHADFPEVQLNLARFAERSGDAPTARRALEAALALDPKLAEAWLRLAQLDVDAQRYEAARRTLERAVVEVPRFGALHQLHGRVLAQLGDPAGAARAFEHAVRELPEVPEIRVEHASLLIQLGRHAEALATLARLSEAARTDPEVLYLLALSHAGLNDMAKARFYARELATRHPESPLIQHLESALAKS